MSAPPPTLRRDRAALLAFIAARQAAPFAWGSNDCVTFAAHAVRAQTGWNPLAGTGLRWRSKRGAQRALVAAGGIAALADRRLTPIAPALAERGDLALVEGADGPLLTVVEGQTLIAPSQTGLLRLPRSAAVRAWSAIRKAD